MIDAAGLAGIFAAFFVVAASPGPATLAVCTVSAAEGRRRGLIFGAGLAAGLSFWGAVAATGLGAVLQASTSLLMALKIAGGLYLLWLAYGAARSAMGGPIAATPDGGHFEQSPQRALFARGLVLNLSNPKAVVAWMAALAVGLGPDAGLLSLLVATFGCALIGLLIYAAYAAAFSVSAVMEGYRKARRSVDGLVATLFAVAGLALIRSAFLRS
jgi:threonine/homoserine/homoserine lactone efflux protein